jgi:tellurite resistance protein TerC
MAPIELWIGFNVVVLFILALDLGVFNRHAHVITLREAGMWCTIWVTLSLSFNFWIWRAHGDTAGVEFLTAYLIEQSLSMDNIFVFLLIFRAFAIEPRFQHRVLFWGVLGAIVLRGTMIALGTVLIQRFHWVLYLFGFFLLYIGAHMLLRGHQDFHPERNPVLRWARKLFPVAETTTDERFFVTENGRRAITPLFLALIVVESSDLVFAVDSIPAVFGVTREPFLVYTSNICAILGLRSFYFLLSGALQLFRYLDDGVSAVLIFVGAKMLAEPWIHIPPLVSLFIVAGLLGTAMVASLIAARRERNRATSAVPPSD